MSKSGTSCDVCPAFMSKCDEQDALRVMEQFKDFYEGKLNEIDVQGGGDCLELKLKIQRRWIDDLTEQTQMMARIVKELEEEATSRVRMLEDKLRQTSKCAYEEAPLIEDNGKPENTDNGNKTHEELIQLITTKSEEYDELRRCMLDMRSALTEEVACKHDMISTLKKDIQQLEERCMQSDKQTAFKDDIIKELRKEIKQLKQQSKDKESDLEQQLKTARNKIKGMKPCVAMVSASTDTEDKQLAARKREKDLEEEISCRQREVEELKCACSELEKSLVVAKGRADNLQKAESKLASKNEVKKLHQQIRYYEHVVDCFKHEMTVMSEQLINLQEILNLSNQSCREENGQLYHAIHELQKLTEKLQLELRDTEKKVLIENQKNQLKDAKIDELHLIIGQKNEDLNIHDEAINEMKIRFEKTLIENQELQNTIAMLNTTVMQLQCLNAETNLTRKSSRSKGVSCRRSLSECRGEYHRTSKRVDHLEQETAKMIQKELDRVKEKHREKIKNLKRQVEDLKEKLGTSELSNERLVQQLTLVQEQTTQLTQRDCSREHELAQSKQAILELRQTLIELNESLAESELHHMALAEEYHKTKTNESRQQEDIYLSCRCEIALYKKLADNFKEALLKTKTALAEVEMRNKSLSDEIKNKDVKIAELVRKAIRKEKESCSCIEVLKEELKASQEEEKRLSGCNEQLQKELKTTREEKRSPKLIEQLQHDLKESREEERRLSQLTEQLQRELKISQEEEKRLSRFIDSLKEEIQKRIEEKRDAERVVISCCDCPDMGATQEEINTLKVEIKSMIQNQIALNAENDKLLKQVAGLRTNILSLEDQNHCLKQKHQKLQEDCRKLKEKNKILSQEKDSNLQIIKNLECELAEAKNNRDDICAESRHVVNNVKAWLQEQRKINDKVMQKTRCYCDTIARLKEQNENLMMGSTLTSPPPCKPKYEKMVRTCVPPEYQSCHSPWCLGSEGFGSVDVSPRDSPASCICSVEEWYSPNYRDEDETDDNDQFIDTLEAITHEIRSSNKKWKSKCQECVVTRDNNK